MSTSLDEENPLIGSNNEEDIHLNGGDDAGGSGMSDAGIDHVDSDRALANEEENPDDQERAADNEGSECSKIAVTSSGVGKGEGGGDGEGEGVGEGEEGREGQGKGNKDTGVTTELPDLPPYFSEVC